MMHERAAFLDEILTHPADDMPRLIYADWLEDRGDPQADLIRVQCEKARYKQGTSEWETCRVRERALLDAHGESWFGSLWKIRDEPGWSVGPFAKFLSSLEFRRGFVREVPITSTWIPANAKPISPLILKVYFGSQIAVTQARKFKGLFSLLGGIPFLTLGDRSFAPAAVRALQFLPETNLLCRLDLNEARINVKTLRTLCQTPQVKHLSSLNLRLNRIGNSGVEAIADAVFARKLHSLNLSGCRISSKGFVRIAGSEALQNLRQLAVSQNNPGYDGIEALVNSEHLSGLRELNLNQCNIDSEMAQLICESPYLRNIERLNLNGNQVSPGVVGLLQERFGEAIPIKNQRLR